MKTTTPIKALAVATMLLISPAFIGTALADREHRDRGRHHEIHERHDRDRHEVRHRHDRRHERRHAREHRRHRYERHRPWGWPGWAYGWRVDRHRHDGYCHRPAHRHWRRHGHDRYGYPVFFFGARTPNFGFAFRF